MKLSALPRAWELKEGLHDLYRDVEPQHACAYLYAWRSAAASSDVPQFRHFSPAASEPSSTASPTPSSSALSNSRTEGLHTKIRVIQRRGYGHRHPHTLAAMIYLCLGGIPVSHPRKRE